MGFLRRLSLLAVALSLLVCSSSAFSIPGLTGPSVDQAQAAAAKAAVEATASNLGWSTRSFGADQSGGTGFGVSSSGADEDVDKAVIVVSDEKGAKALLDTFAENGMPKTTFHGYEAVQTKKGDKICNAGGTTGYVLGFIKSAVKTVAPDADTSQICAEATGTVGWACGGAFLIANSPGQADRSQEIAEALYSSAAKHGVCNGSGLEGRITDGHGHPMAYMTLTLTLDGKDYPGYTDEAGNYKLTNINGLAPDPDNPPEPVLAMELSYVRDGTNYFFVVGDDGKPMKYTKKFKLKKDADLRQDIDLNLAAPNNAKTLKVGDSEYAVTNWAFLWGATHFAGIYYYIGDATDFYLTILNAKLDNLPLKIKIGGDSTFYSTDGHIQIGGADGLYTSPDRPKNREYHEFSHYVMYSEYGSWPTDAAGDKNHNGFLNGASADSYTEGFAEFMAMVISEYTNDPDVAKPPNQYPTGWNALDNNKVWERRGRSEERAFASALYDLHAKNNPNGASLGLSIQDMWKVLKVKRDNFQEVYAAFIAAYPDKKDTIDKIFVQHHVFADKNKGNNKYDNFEPFKDANKNGAYDAGESYVDLGVINSTAEIRYDAGETVGKSTNYQRPQRMKDERIPDAYIKAADASVRFYTVSVHFSRPGQGEDREYTTENRQGLIYVDPLPEGVDATLTVKPKSQDYAAGSVYTLTAKDYDTKWYASEGKGSFDTHDFKLKPTGQHKDPTTQTLDGKPPAWQADGGHDHNNQQTTQTETGGSNGETGAGNPKSTCSCLPALTLIIAGAASLIGNRI